VLPLELGGSCKKAAHTVLCYLEMLLLHVWAQTVVTLDQEMQAVVSVVRAGMGKLSPGQTAAGSSGSGLSEGVSHCH